MNAPPVGGRGRGGEPAVLVDEPGAAIVDARELGLQVVEIDAREGVAAVGQVEGPAHQPRDLLLGGIGLPSAAGNSAGASRCMTSATISVALLPRVHGVEDVAGLAAEPADVLGRAAALHDADVGALVGLPGVGRHGPSSRAPCSPSAAGSGTARGSP